MSQVGLIQCVDYDRERVRRALRQALDCASFNPASFSGRKVAMKPNLLLASAPEKAIITHPEFARAVAELIVEHGGRPLLIESPPFYPLAKMIPKIGYDAWVKEFNVEVADDRQGRTLTWEGGRRIHQADISAAYFDADIIVNLPKFKTHGCTYISGAVKNLFGALPGITKSKMHLRFPENDDFADWLLDLATGFIRGFTPQKPLINIMDAVLGLEGEGPGPAGTPRRIGVIVAGADPVAVDYIATSVAGLDPNLVPTIARGWDRGFGAARPEEIQFAGAKISDVQISDFVPTRATISSHFMRGRLVGPRVKNLVLERPSPDPAKCTLCYRCRTVCPAGAIGEAPAGKRRPRYDYNKCIRCFCCMEMCPEAAISLKRGRWQWVVELGSRLPR